jgi:transcriptional regulator NrdR family protein
MTNVAKRNGEIQPFEAEKIRNSIRKAAIDAGLSPDKKKKMIEGVAKKATEMAEQKGQIETSALRDKILNELNQSEPKVAEAWRKFDQKYKTKVT